MWVGYWELNPGPLEEHPVLSTTEPSFQPQNLILYVKINKHIHFISTQIRFFSLINGKIVCMPKNGFEIFSDLLSSNVWCEYLL